MIGNMLYGRAVLLSVKLVTEYFHFSNNVNNKIVILSLMYDFHTCINETHVLSVENGKADTISRKQWDRFK